MFNLDGHRIARLTPEDAPAVQELYARCTDYNMAHEGTPTRATTGEEELKSLPPGRNADDKFAFGIYAADSQLIGYLELFRNYPVDADWWIGLLMLDPKVRGRGLGSGIFRSASRWAAANGARRPYQSQAEKKCHDVFVMRHEIAPSADGSRRR